MKPCPFCGSDHINFYETDYCGDYYSPSITLECGGCLCKMELDGSSDVKNFLRSLHMAALKTEIILQWNKRI